MLETKIMAHSHADNVAIITDVVAYMDNKDNQAALAAKQFDLAPHLARLGGKLKAITDLHAQQNKLKVDLANKTAEVEAAAADGYTDASGLIDAVGGVLGKNTPAAHKLQAIRSKLHHASPAPDPTPAPSTPQK